ncbi:MAG: SAM-dependent methyltransferase [Acidimicrobiales bacterium]
MTTPDLLVRAEIARRGPIPFAEVVERALYGPGGFYETGGRAGRRGDFLTSPEVGPLFGAVVARALDAWWREAGEPRAFAVVEAGAGPGTLARSVLAAEPACAPALRYVLVERSGAQRLRHAERLPLEDPVAAFASVPDPDDDHEAHDADLPPGPIVVSRSDLPRLPGPVVVVANELLDNLPFGLLERTADGWAEVRIDEQGGQLVEVLVPLAEGPAVDAPVGARVPQQDAARAWLQDALALAGAGGRVLAFDYAASTDALAARPWTEWVRTYRQHERGVPPLEDLGSQDITCEVAVDQLGVAPSSNRSQADWLRAHGIDDLVEEGRRTWQERAAIGDLDAVRARSRTTEAAALLDESGLGAFRALEWGR